MPGSSLHQRLCEALALPANQTRGLVVQSPGSPQFCQASDDGESIGHCPFCQRLFMVLLLKGVPFTLTTVDVKRSLDVLKAFAPGSQLPVLLYDGEPKTDTIKIEEFLEETLRPPKYPSLVPRYKESFTAGNDVFHKFSAYIKNPLPAQDEGEGLSSLRVADEHSALQLGPAIQEALLRKQRAALGEVAGGNSLSVEDKKHCCFSPQVVCEHYRQFGIPKDLRGIWQYLNNAQEVKEFKYTCPNNEEIVQAYSSVDRSITK
uniref:Chloride intracellular channel 3 n=1 Tax=Crocodylus porosus TaxID=8502 RepID=A0A7M4EUZ5_CROPO